MSAKTHLPYDVEPTGDPNPVRPYGERREAGAQITWRLPDGTACEPGQISALLRLAERRGSVE